MFHRDQADLVAIGVGVIGERVDRDGLTDLGAVVVGVGDRWLVLVALPHVHLDLALRRITAIGYDDRNRPHAGSGGAEIADRDRAVGAELDRSPVRGSGRVEEDEITIWVEPVVDEVVCDRTTLSYGHPRITQRLGCCVGLPAVHGDRHGSFGGTTASVFGPVTERVGS